MLMVNHSKSLESVEKMRGAATVLVGVLEMIEAYVKPGVTTGYLDKLCSDYIVDNGGVPACVGYQGYQHATCISVNHVVCHGIPGEKTLKDGDLLNIDVVVARDGMHADSSAMYFAGKPTIAAKRLAAVTQELSLPWHARSKARCAIGQRWGGDTGTCRQARVQRGSGFLRTRDWCRHA